MNKEDVIRFFDLHAPSWDAEMVKDDGIIGKILDNAGVRGGMDILDVACGTGVMFPYYLERGVSSVTGIDISPKMAQLAAKKFADRPEIRVLCGDVEQTRFDRQFDAAVVYNAFPHFPDPARLIRVLWSHLAEGGRLTVAHGASRETIDAHHSGAARTISNGLMPAEDLAELLRPWFRVETIISDEKMYQVSGVKRC